jgi:MSHA biogenesis protein MshJ
MKALAKKTRLLTQWLDTRSPRERVMLFAAVLAVVLFCSYALYFSPRMSRRTGIEAQISELNATVTTLQGQAEAIRARSKVDPDREQRARQAQLRTELERLDGRLKDLTVDLISPRDMAGVLHSLLVRQEGMKLVRLENLPAEDLFPAAENKTGADGKKQVHLYRHPMRIVFSGTYLQVLEYLRSLEKLPRKLFWDDLDIVVVDHPQAAISLTVHTLSLRKGWIGV